MTLLFDSHSFVKRLTAAGMPEPQAEALAGEHTRWFEDGLATKRDLAPLAKSADLADLARHAELKELATKAELREMELRIDVRIEAGKSELLKWRFGAIGFQTLVLLGAIVALARAIH